MTYGFDTAWTLAEETNDPRRAAPRVILGALATAALIGVLAFFRGLVVEHSGEHRGRITAELQGVQ